MKSLHLIFIFSLISSLQGGVVGFWNFSETSGTVAHDGSGSGINGNLTATGVTFSPGAGPNGGGAISLTTGWVDMGNNFAFSGTQAFSIQVWIKTTQTTSGTPLSRHYSNNQDGYFVGFNNFDPFCLDSSYNNKAGAFAGDGGNGCNLNGPAISVTPPSMATVNNGSWHQIVVTLGGGIQSLYVDGAFQGSASGVNISSCPTVDFIVGGYNIGAAGANCGVGTPTGSFTGMISDVAVWNETLTATQVQAAFQNPGNPSATDTVSAPAVTGFWNFSETSGTVAHDSSGSGINGNLTATGAAFSPGAGPNGGGAISLTTGWVDMGNNFAFSGTQSFSIQVWIKSTQTTAGHLVTRHYSNNQDGYIVGMNNIDSFCLGSTYNNKAAALAGDGGSGCNLSGPGISVTPASSVTVNDGAWHQILVTFGGGTESLYVDGAFQGSAGGVNISSCPTVDFLVGGYNIGGSGPCGVGTPTGTVTGLISDVAIWNGTLTAAQVRNAFQNPGNPSAIETMPAPTLAASGVESGASYLPGVVPGSWLVIQGKNLAAIAADTWANSIVAGVLPKSLDGVSVSIGGQAADIYYVSPGQLNVLAPNVSPGPALLTVTTPSGTSAPVTVTVAAAAPAFFQWPGNQAVATRTDGTYATKPGTFAGTVTAAAHPGDVIILWGTGFGATTPAVPQGVVVPATQQYNCAPVTAALGTTNLTVYGCALSPGSAGLYQVAVQIPAGIANGDYPVTVSVYGVSSPGGVILSVSN